VAKKIKAPTTVRVVIGVAIPNLPHEATAVPLKAGVVAEEVAKTEYSKLRRHKFTRHQNATSI
jgi:hypothetical protein